jgi:phage recombination protein Bet
MDEGTVSRLFPQVRNYTPNSRKVKIMSTALINFDQEEIQLVKSQIAPGATDGQLALFIQVCKQTGLNPFARQIYAVFRNEWVDGKTEKRMTIQTSIDGYRLLAQRSGEYAGQEGPWWYDDKKREWVDLWLEEYPPAAAKVGVMRKGFVQPIYAVASFKSYAARKKDGSLTTMWVKIPEVMIAKVAESLALRRAFPAELSGIYTDAEMEQADTTAQTVAVATQVRPQTEEDKKKARLNNLFKAGKAKGLFLSKDEMAEYCTDVLQTEITADDIASLDDEQLTAVEQEVEASGQFAEAS